MQITLHKINQLCFGKIRAATEGVNQYEMRINGESATNIRFEHSFSGKSITKAWSEHAESSQNTIEM